MHLAPMSKMKRLRNAIVCNVNIYILHKIPEMQSCNLQKNIVYAKLEIDVVYR